MSFVPIIPIAGYAGWRFLQQTIQTQKGAFVESPPVKRAAQYFRDNIAKVRTAEELVGNRRLLEVALGAFGLDNDIDNRFFIKKVLEDGTTSPDALSSRLADKRYAALSKAFGFGDVGVARTGFSNFADDILARYENRQFERAVGAQDNTMRLALSLSSELNELIDQTSSDRAQWFGMMGNKPLRRVVEGALGLPESFGRLDIDQQLQGFRNRARSVFGTDKLSDLAAPAQQEKLVRLFLIRSEAAASSVSVGSIALTLLQNAGINPQRFR